jgi:hypothetical protein
MRGSLGISKRRYPCLAGVTPVLSRSGTGETKSSSPLTPQTSGRNVLQVLPFCFSQGSMDSPSESRSELGTMLSIRSKNPCLESPRLSSYEVAPVLSGGFVGRNVGQSEKASWAASGSRPDRGAGPIHRYAGWSLRRRQRALPGCEPIRGETLDPANRRGGPAAGPRLGWVSTCLPRGSAGEGAGVSQGGPGSRSRCSLTVTPDVDGREGWLPRRTKADQFRRWLWLSCRGVSGMS